MNTNKLKKFAQNARRKLLSEVTSKLEYLLTTDSAELREKSTELKNLQIAINETSKAQVIEKVAYTWFNRLMALRFMDANNYQPLGIGIVSPKDGYSLPEILDEAKQGNIPRELSINHQQVFDLLDGKITSSNIQNEAYKDLLVGACNHLNTVFPFLFERINDYTELLLPNDLTSEFSIVQDVVEGMTAEDCQEVEIIGWLYQFYISELNDELIRSKKKYAKEEIAPASQLFTPKWIVEYMVDNTLGQLWTEIKPDSKVHEELDYYIQPAYKDQLKIRKGKSIEEVKFFEPCMGSGHILAYAFDVFYKIYQEEGYNPSEIPELIITKNLFGVDIDQRAAQLSAFVLLMKGRQKNRRFLKHVEKKSIQPNVTFYRDFEFDNKFNNASVLGSLIKVNESEADKIKIEEGSLFTDQQKQVKQLYMLLGQRYDCVVTNPPYISSSRMEGSLKQYVEKNWPETKTDLFATFVLRCLELCNEEGVTGYMTPFVWMFISSYEKLRTEIIDMHFINNLVQLEYSGFDGATVPICTFTLRNQYIKQAKGSYIRLSDFKGSTNQAPRTLEAIQSPNCGWFFEANQIDFKRIDGNLLGYWLNEIQISSIESDNSLEDEGVTRRGLQTGDSPRFVRNWYEINYSEFEEPQNYSTSSIGKWFVLNSGGNFRRWYGNLDTVVIWRSNGEKIKSTGRAIIPSEHLYFKSAIVWNKITSGSLGFRFQSEGVIPGDASPGYFPQSNDTLIFTLGFLNSKVVTPLLALFAPTLNAQVGDLKKIPLKYDRVESISKVTNELIEVSKLDWHNKISSWGFKSNNLLSLNALDIEEALDLYQQYWKNKFFQLHQNEEELNRQFINIYGLQEELSPSVALEKITILKDETKIENGQLVFQKAEILKQFVNYAVGCMFGRYSLDKEDLILANLGETLKDFLEKVGKGESDLSFLPDRNNIIPILDDEWFEDDIAGRFYEFLKATFGKDNFEKNLAFVEECIGKDIRKFFVKDFYSDHIKRYKKRPIYWMFSSSKGSFNVLIYLHRYTPDTLNQVLNGYLREYKEKLNTRLEQLDHLIETGSSSEQTKSAKEKDKLKLVLIELDEYEREVIYPLATQRISIDLDDGVLVNYNKFGNAIKEVKGLNDKTTKEKVRKFDWINAEEII